MGHFTRKTFAFLGDLGAHNEKAWFEAHKDEFETHVRTPALEFVEAVDQWMVAKGLPYRGVAKKVGGSLGRIHRDLRFSKDKTPYNDYLLIHFKHADSKNVEAMPGIGVRLNVDGAGMGAGIWMPSTATLTQIRDGLIADPKGWKKAKGDMELRDDRLKTAPRGYDKEHPLIEDLRLRSFVAHTSISKRDATGDFLAAFQKNVKPLIRFNDFLTDQIT